MNFAGNNIALKGLFSIPFGRCLSFIKVRRFFFFFFFFGAILAIEGPWAGFCFFQFCDIENLVRISQKIAKLVKFTLEKQKTSQIYLSKKLQNLPQKTPQPLG